MIDIKAIERSGQRMKEVGNKLGEIVGVFEEDPSILEDVQNVTVRMSLFSQLGLAINIQIGDMSIELKNAEDIVDEAWVGVLRPLLDYVKLYRGEKQDED